jgi:hypothetical protein
VCCQGQVTATGRPLVERSPTECVVCACVCGVCVCVWCVRVTECDQAQH